MAEKFKVYSTTAARLPELPVRNGNLIFVNDSRQICLDIHGNRLTYDTIQIFHNEYERLNYISPAAGFYFVEETHVFWRYDNDWIQISSSNVDPIFFGDVEDFPSIGQSTTLYISGDATYRWNNITQCYEIVANKTAWEIME